MSCISPVYIKNPRINYRRGIDKQYIQVPCGHCVGCHRRTIDDWYVRLRSELDNYQSKGGCCFYVTLTYNEDMLPELNTVELAPIINAALERHYIEERYNAKTTEELREVEKKKPHYLPIEKTRACFDKTHIVAFQKALRQLLHNRFGVDGLKFWTVCEYGDHTRRPHYHSLIFCPENLDQYSMMDCLELAWSKEVKRDLVPDRILAVASHLYLSGSCHNKVSYYDTCEHQYLVSKNPRHKNYHFHQRLGNVSFSQKWGAKVTFPLGILYVLEYMFKQDNFFSNGYDLESAIHNLPSEQDCKAWFSDYVCEMIKFVKGALPFRHSSQNIGIKLIQELDGIEKTATGYDCTDSFEPSMVFEDRISYPDQINKTYSFPLTLVNRLLRHHDPYIDLDGKRKFHVRMSPLATKLAMYKLNRQLDNVNKFYQFVLSPAFVSLADDLSRKTVAGEFFHTWLSKAREIGSQRLAVYSVLFRDVDYSVSTNYVDIFDRFEAYNFNVYTYNMDQPDYHALHHLFTENNDDHFVRDFTKYFGVFDNLLDFISNLFGEVSLRQHLKAEIDKNEKYRLRDIYNSLKFNPLTPTKDEQVSKIF